MQTVKVPAAGKVVRFSATRGSRMSHEDKREHGRELEEICRKFDQLKTDDQTLLLLYTRGYVLGPGGRLDRRQEFKSVLDVGLDKFSHTYRAISEAADTLLKGGVL
jgi:hypothetical protein